MRCTRPPVERRGRTAVETAGQSELMHAEGWWQECIAMGKARSLPHLDVSVVDVGSHGRHDGADAASCSLFQLVVRIHCKVAQRCCPGVGGLVHGLDVKKSFGERVARSCEEASVGRPGPACFLAELSCRIVVAVALGSWPKTRNLTRKRCATTPLAPELATQHVVRR